MSQKLKLNYLHIGQGKLVSLEKMIGIFSVESLQKNKANQCYLSDYLDEIIVKEAIENSKKIKTIILDLEETKFLSPIKSSTLLNRFKKLKKKWINSPL